MKDYFFKSVRSKLTAIIAVELIVVIGAVLLVADIRQKDTVEVELLLRKDSAIASMAQKATVSALMANVEGSRLVVDAATQRLSELAYEEELFREHTDSFEMFIRVLR